MTTQTTRLNLLTLEAREVPATLVSLNDGWSDASLPTGFATALRGETSENLYQVAISTSATDRTDYRSLSDGAEFANGPLPLGWDFDMGVIV